jgi:ribonuclease R
VELTEIGKHITFTEERADNAERELTAVLILQMLSNRIGEELECVTTGLTGFGVFVQSRKFGIDGLIRMEDLGPDQWKFDKRTQSILGLRSGHSIRLGQSLNARIVSVNVPARQLNLTPAEPLIKPAAEKRQAQKSKKHKKTREEAPRQKRRMQKGQKRHK